MGRSQLEQKPDRGRTVRGEHAAPGPQAEVSRASGRRLWGCIPPPSSPEGSVHQGLSGTINKKAGKTWAQEKTAGPSRRVGPPDSHPPACQRPACKGEGHPGLQYTGRGERRVLLQVKYLGQHFLKVGTFLFCNYSEFSNS